MNAIADKLRMRIFYMLGDRGCKGSALKNQLISVDFSDPHPSLEQQSAAQGNGADLRGCLLECQDFSIIQGYRAAVVSSQAQGAVRSICQDVAVGETHRSGDFTDRFGRA